VIPNALKDLKGGLSFSTLPHALTTVRGLWWWLISGLSFALGSTWLPLSFFLSFFRPHLHTTVPRSLLVFFLLDQPSSKPLILWLCRMSFSRVAFIFLFLTLQSIPPVLYYYNQYRFVGLATPNTFSQLHQKGPQQVQWPLRTHDLFDLPATRSALDQGLLFHLASSTHSQTVLDNFSNRLLHTPNSTILTAGLIASLIPFSSSPSPSSGPSLSLQLPEIVDRLFDHAVDLFVSVDRFVQSSFDPFDERYCWRMFSSLSQASSCSVKFSTKTPSGIYDLDLQRIGFHSAWIELLSTCRLTIRDRVGRQLCRTSPNPSLPVFRKTNFHLRSPIDSSITSHWPSLGIDQDFSLIFEEGQTNICPSLLPSSDF